MDKIIELSNIEYQYTQNHFALQNISLDIYEGEILSIIGCNGSGKSTMLHIICGLIFSQKGKYLFKNQLINETTLKDSKFNQEFRKAIGYIFQNSDDQLFCPTVIDEIVFGPLQAGISKDESYKRAFEVMEMLGITELKDRPTYMLSGGEKKRVAIGSILSVNPSILVLDEPLSGLDPRSRSFIIELIFNLNKIGKTIIIATHLLELVQHYQSRVAVLSENHTIAKIGNVNEVLSDVELLKNCNLIDEYPHQHGKELHRHLLTGFLFHKHQ